MTDSGVLFVEEGLEERLADDIEAAIPTADTDGFRLNGEGTPEPETVGGRWGNVEARWPDSSEIPIMFDDERIGTLTVTMESTIKRDMTGAEYVGRELSNYEITAEENE